MKRTLTAVLTAAALLAGAATASAGVLGGGPIGTVPSGTHQATRTTPVPVQLDEPVEMFKVVPLRRLSLIASRLSAGGWSCTVEVNLATGLPRVHGSGWSRAYYYSCTQ